MQEHGFLQSFVFQYSPRPGTAAFEHLPDDVPAEVKARRNHRLLELQREIARGRTPRLVGTRSTLLLEQHSEHHPDSWFGRTATGHGALLAHRPGFRPGLLREVELQSWNGRELLATETDPASPIAAPWPRAAAAAGHPPVLRLHLAAAEAAPAVAFPV